MSKKTKKAVEPRLSLFLVRSNDGQWLRRKGFSGDGECWTDDIKNARVYWKIGQARAQVTIWANMYPDYGTAEVVELEATIVATHDEAKRVEDRNKAEEERERKARIKAAQAKIDEATAELDDAVEEVRRPLRHPRKKRRLW